MGQLLGKLDILYAEYDGEDFSLFLEAVQENGFSSNIQRVNDGQELVDFFISEDFRGEKYEGIKYYQHLLNEVFKQAKLINKNSKEVTLAVEENNEPAIHIYLKNKFKIFKNTSKQRFTFPKKKFIYMKLKI